MCRPGFYCPSPELQLPCPPGSWCAQATVEPTTCEYPVLMTELPDLTISDVPLTVVQRVYGKGDPLGGNICPPVSNLHLPGLGLCACTAGQKYCNTVELQGDAGSIRCAQEPEPLPQAGG